MSHFRLTKKRSRFWIALSLAWAVCCLRALPAPAADPPNKERQFWSFRPLERPALPKVKSTRVRTPIDAFLSAKLESKGLDFAPDANRAMLLRRAYLDLIGLPPTPEESAQFLKDERPDAYERLLDRLLASPHFGERWGRHWLDAAGYADVRGTDNDAGIIRMAEGMWRYRDYVIRSFNEDKPFDRFLLEQLAGDELVDWRGDKKWSPETFELLIATGFLRTAADDTAEDELNTLDIRHGVLQRTVEVVAGNLLGLTLNCAKCHDHKYEPISQEDYYRLTAVFSPAFNPAKWLQPKDRALPDVSPSAKAEIDKTNAEIGRQIAEWQKQKDEVSKKKDLSELDKTLLNDLERKMQDLNKKKRGFGSLQAVYDIGPPTATHLLKRGDHLKPGPEIVPGLLSVLCPPDRTELPASRPRGASSGRRLALAQWLTKPDTPASALVARTQVNRVWQRLFGKGIVSTTDNLGVSGARPTQPELLDWLAAEFIQPSTASGGWLWPERDGWRLKPLLKLIMTSSAYRQSSIAPTAAKHGPDPVRVDPANQLLWRMPLRRLEAEIIRDSMLAASGKLDRALGGPPVPLVNRPDGLVVIEDAGKHRRSVYVLARRNYHLSMLNVFDQPFMTTNCLGRTSSATVLQSLTMLHDAFVLEQARSFAERVTLLSGGAAADEQVRTAYQLVLARPPRETELAACVDFLRRQEERRLAAKDSPEEARRQALIGLCHVLLNSNEFLYAP